MPTIWKSMVATMLLIALAAAFWFIPVVPKVQPFGTTTGEVLVSSPEVYSRERLVNDRFQEATWLGEELRNMDELSWGPQASMQSKGTGVRSIDIQGASTESATGGATDSGAHATADGRDPQPGQTEHGNSTRSGDGQTPATAVGESPIDVFRNRVAFREEVRATALETQLDDRHDIAGNTLYRIKFNVSVVPEHDTSAWALVYVELSEPDPGSRDRIVYADIFHEWLEFYEDQLNYELDRLTEEGAVSWEPDEFRSFRAFITSAMRRDVCYGARQECATAVDAAIQDKLTHLREDARKRAEAGIQDCNTVRETNPAVQCLSKAQVEADCASASGQPRLCPWYLDTRTRIEALLQVYRDMLYRDRPSVPHGADFFRRTVADYLLRRLEHRTDRRWDRLWKAKLVDCDVGLCRIKLKSQSGAVPHFAQALRADQVFAYAVSPKESVQRIASLASSQQLRRIALHSKLGGEPVPADLANVLLKQSNQDDELLQTILRKPLVVGFAEPANSAENKYGDVARFGWIVGPKFDVAERQARFRHAVTSNDVSAIVSVPSWWRWAVVQVTTCWIDEREVRQRSGNYGLELYRDCTAKAHRRTDLVRLPGNVTEIARKLGLDVVRRPSVSQTVDTKVVVAGRSAEILIRGNHLWRSTVVTLEGQLADNITVLPDMKGIVARFQKISPQLVGSGRRVWVFTSEGEAFAGRLDVTVDPSTQRPPTDGLLPTAHEGNNSVTPTTLTDVGNLNRTRRMIPAPPSMHAQ